MRGLSCLIQPFFCQIDFSRSKFHPLSPLPPSEVRNDSLNFNPHVHLVGTTAIIHKETKEVLHLSFLRYKKFAFSWMKAFCKHYEKEKVLTKAESLVIQNKYKNGFHVYFQPIAGDEKEPLFRTAEYIASGFFHT